MPHESYTNLHIPELLDRVERMQKTDDAVDVAKQIIDEHSFLDEDDNRRMPEVYWPNGELPESNQPDVWLTLLGEDGRVATGVDPEVAAVRFDIATPDAINSVTVFQIDLTLFEIRNFDDQLVSSSDIDKIVADLQRYDEAIKTGQTVPPPTVSS